MKLMEYTFADRHGRMELLRNHDADRYFRMLELSIDESESIARLLMYAAYVHGCVRIGRGREQWHYLHKSPKYAGCLQLTTWDEYGPVSDERISDAGDFSYLMNGTVAAYVERTYGKEDIRACAPMVQLYGDETLADAHCVRWER